MNTRIMNPESVPFSLHRLREGTVNQILKDRSPNGLTNVQIENGLQQLVETINKLKLHPNPLRGRHMLRFCPMPGLTGLGSEKVFEKNLAQEAQPDEKGGQIKKWANQIPIWSGICGSGNRQTNIDVGYARCPHEFSLYELKIGSDHPLYAIIELITYALGYLIVRKLANERSIKVRDKQTIEAHDGGLLSATAISFSVIAPQKFYDKRIRQYNMILSRRELENIRTCAEEVLRRAAKRDSCSKCLQITFSLHAMPIEIPGRFRDRNGSDNWIKELTKANGSLRKLVLNAPNLNKCCPELSE